MIFFDPQIRSDMPEYYFLCPFYICKANGNVLLYHIRCANAVTCTTPNMR